MAIRLGPRTCWRLGALGAGLTIPFGILLGTPRLADAPLVVAFIVALLGHAGFFFTGLRLRAEGFRGQGAVLIGSVLASLALALGMLVCALAELVTAGPFVSAVWLVAFLAGFVNLAVFCLRTAAGGSRGRLYRVAGGLLIAFLLAALVFVLCAYTHAVGGRAMEWLRVLVGYPLAGATTLLTLLLLDRAAGAADESNTLGRGYLVGAIGIGVFGIHVLFSPFSGSVALLFLAWVLALLGKPLVSFGFFALARQYQNGWARLAGYSLLGYGLSHGLILVALTGGSGPLALAGLILSLVGVLLAYVASYRTFVTLPRDVPGAALFRPTAYAHLVSLGFKGLAILLMLFRVRSKDALYTVGVLAAVVLIVTYTLLFLVFRQQRAACRAAVPAAEDAAASAAVPPAAEPAG